MIFRKISFLNMTVGLFIALCLPSLAMSQQGSVIPDHIPVPFAESGNWWDTARPGEGLMLERQGNTVAMILFTYTASGEPDFYLASAQLKVSPFAGDPPPMAGAAALVFIAQGELYRFSNGPVFNSDRNYFEGDPSAYETEPIGIMNAAISPNADTLRVRILLDEDKVPEGSKRSTSRTYKKSAFGYAGFGRYAHDSSRPHQASRTCWTDLRGRWVFVDNSTPTARDAWSFNFTELEASPAPQDMLCRGDGDNWFLLADHTLLYRDTETGATLRCITKSVIPGEDPNYQPENHRCTLRTDDGEALLWFSVQDAGVKQIIANPGTPPESHMFWRGSSSSERITGLRLD